MGHFFVSALGCLGGIVLSFLLCWICDSILDAQFGKGVSTHQFPNMNEYFHECRRQARSCRLQTLFLAFAMTAVVGAVLAFLFGWDSGVTRFGIVFAMFCSVLLKSL